MYDEMISSGKALDKMRQVIRIQNGDARVVDDYDLLPRSDHVRTIHAISAGIVHAIDTEAIGRASMLLGAGRARIDSPIDLSVGVIVRARVGDEVNLNAPLADIHFNEASRADEAAGIIERAYAIGDHAVEPPKLIHAVIR